MTPAMDEGYIKFSAERVDGTIPYPPALGELNRARTDLFDLGLIGCYDDGIGFGNLSLRDAGQTFLITASATGGKRELRLDQYCLVESFSPEHNSVRSRGQLMASSESMTHGSIYAASPAVNCVMHIHSRALFDALIARGTPQTAADVPYGTPAMAQAVSSLVQAQHSLPVLFVMAGHDEGVIAYGTDIASVRQLIIQTFNQIIHHG